MMVVIDDDDDDDDARKVDLKKEKINCRLAPFLIPDHSLDNGTVVV